MAMMGSEWKRVLWSLPQASNCSCTWAQLSHPPGPNFLFRSQTSVLHHAEIIWQSFRNTVGSQQSLRLVLGVPEVLSTCPDLPFSKRTMSFSCFSSQIPYRSARSLFLLALSLHALQLYHLSYAFNSALIHLTFRAPIQPCLSDFHVCASVLRNDVIWGPLVCGMLRDLAVAA